MKAERVGLYQEEGETGGGVELFRFDGSLIHDLLLRSSSLAQLSRNSKGRTREFEKPDPINYVFCLLLAVQ